jgi:hypothetical protein
VNTKEKLNDDKQKMYNEVEYKMDTNENSNTRKIKAKEHKPWLSIIKNITTLSTVLLSSVLCY